MLEAYLASASICSSALASLASRAAIAFFCFVLIECSNSLNLIFNSLFLKKKLF